MTVLILSFVLLLFVVLAMSVGVLLGRRPIKGSCGGMSSLGMETACDICGGDTSRCEKESLASEDQNRNMAYDASSTAPSSNGIKNNEVVS